MNKYREPPSPTARSRKHFDDDAPSHDRWLISYADFITLLFAFFVVMYAISSVNNGKYRVLSNSLGAAFGSAPIRIVPTVPVEPPSVLPGRPPAAERQRIELLRREKESMTSIARDILNVLSPLISSGKVRVTQTSRGVSVEINASVLFAPGEASLTSESGAALSAIAQVLSQDTHAIQIEGHTDNLPIGNATFPSNWELSSVRASSVVRLFANNGIAGNRLTAVGHGSNKPVGSNDTPEGRVRNRRVEVLILATLPEVVTEVPLPAGTAP
ncbi:flagellar motor protein MotD [Actimicrobium sp. CCC2.4]|uniref:flagellar motor protein MotD n=1 Tax=Actimicrobium sp. CCC2.4 TaxID=3048606 RepID=UPI002AC9E52C|nr:flagellar motor protein MotD [Actimicrobium sp. CCC2.4]MEB0135713.1 flagellar motor protein MotD [Actimicrobium sp. CCC2.4]WPX34132.1 flagellar motor protein MotD [Actimicrobium sp. CCC2.4]